MEALIEDSIAHIARHEDPQRFIGWMREHIHDYYTGPDVQQGGLFGEAVDPDQVIMDPEMLRALGVTFANMIWNSTPLPSNHFKPRSLPPPGRNDPCPCSSGRKYKQCCAQLPAMPALSVDELWPILFEKLGTETAARAIRENQVPINALSTIAYEYLESDQPKKAATLLAPLFDGNIRKTNDDAEYVLTLLCNALADLGHKKKKITLLQKIIDTVPRSPLRSGAWQRLSTIRMDNGDVDGAWDAFQHAQRDDPESLGLGLLEVQILNAQDRNEKAKQRADFWVRQMRRAGVADDEMPLAFLIEVARDPVAAFTDLGLGFVDDAGLLLKQWLGSVQGRPLPEYAIDDGKSLQPPPGLDKLEQEWHEIFPLDKPFSVHETPAGNDDPWDILEEETWASWLQDHPAAFDSLDILDDLATALMQHPQFGAAWLNEMLLLPLLNRSMSITEKALAAAEGPQLHWVIPDNRPALRTMARLVNISFFMEDDQEEGLRRAQRLISINPNDNHGFRTMVMNRLITRGLDEEALQLAEGYPRDINPEVTYGKILVLYRLGRKKDAVEELGHALESLGKIPRYLTAKRVRKPKLRPDTVQFGGDDQAWLYREAMRDVWSQTLGALAWLKTAEKAFQ